jgi:hypothetical protein
MIVMHPAQMLTQHPITVGSHSIQLICTAPQVLWLLLNGNKCTHAITHNADRGFETSGYGFASPTR